MEVRRIVLVEVHRNYNSQETAYFRHAISLFLRRLSDGTSRTPESTWNSREGARSPRAISPICRMLSVSCSNSFLSIRYPIPVEFSAIFAFAPESGCPAFLSHTGRLTPQCRACTECASMTLIKQRHTDVEFAFSEAIKPDPAISAPLKALLRCGELAPCRGQAWKFF